MLYLLLITNLYAGLVDNCTSDNCSMIVSKNGIIIYKEFGKGVDIRSEASMYSNENTVTLSNTNQSEESNLYREIGAASKILCEKVYDMVMGYNMSKSFTTAQLNQMKVDFMSAHDYIKKDCQPHAAKAAIEAIAADPNKFTQEFKDLVLNEFAKAGY